MNRTASKVLPILLSILGSAGVVGTAIFVAKDTLKAQEKIKSIEQKSLELDARPDKLEIVKQVAPCYIRSAVIGGMTIASIVAGTIISKKTEASLSAACIAIDQGYRKYKGKVKEIFGLEGHGKVLGEISKEDFEKRHLDEPKDGTMLFHEEHLGWFKATPEEFALMYGDLNQRLHVYDYAETAYYVMLYNIMKDHNIEFLDKDKFTPEQLRWGWSYDQLIDMYNYAWVHMHYEDVTTENGKHYREVYFEEEMVYDPGNFGEDFLDSDPDLESVKEFLGVDSNYVLESDKMDKEIEELEALHKGEKNEKHI